MEGISPKIRFLLRHGHLRTSVLSAVLAVLILCLTILCLGPAALAQTSTTGLLKGQVTDPSGRAVANADVRATNEATHEERAVKSGQDGSYVIPLLPPGRYQVDIEASGFARATLKGVILTVTETTVENVPLKVGTTSTTVEVKVAAPLVETSTNALGDVVTGEQVESLPLVNRNFTQIMTLSAGVVASVTDATEVGRGSGGLIPTNEGQGENINGARASDINFRMDGVDVNDYDGSGAGVPIPNPDTIQEFKVQTAMYDAEYGRDAGANVNLVTKTGSNAFHGNVFEFWRNDVLNANDFFQNLNGAPRPELKQNQFGGTFGGPIVKDKLFFFTSYQGTRQVNGVHNRETFYSPLTTNDRSAASIAALFAGQQGLQYIFGPPGFGPAIDPTNSPGDVFPYNINPVALTLLQETLPNGQFLFPTANPANNLVSLSSPSHFREDQVMANFDYIQSQKNTIQGRFFTAPSKVIDPFGYGTGNGANLPGTPSTDKSSYLVASLSDNYMVTPNLFNQVRLGYDRISARITPDSPFTFSGLGVDSSAQNNSQPSITIAGSDNFNAGIYSPNTQDLFNFEDDIAWVHGHHSFRFGGGVVRNYLVNSGEQYYGQVTFPSWPDFLLGMNGVENGTAGIPVFPPNGFSNVQDSVELLGVLAGHGRTWEISAYGQDDWRVTPKLTLNLGLRWEWLPPFTNLGGRATNINPALINPNPPDGGSVAGYVVPANWPFPVPTGVVKSGINGFVPGSGNNTWGPRLGFAWSVLPSDKFVVRGGYGIYYSAVTGNSQFQSIPGLPWALIGVFFPPYNGSASWQQPFQEPIPPASQFPFFDPYTPDSDLSSIATQQTIRPAITQQFALNVQTAITPTLALQLGFVGSNSNHLIYSHSINQAGSATPQNPIRGETSNNLSNIALRVPYEGWDPAGFQGQGSWGRSNFNAMEVTLKKNVSHGLQFLAAYTWSKTMSTGAANIVGSTFGGGTIGDQNNLYAGYGEANFSRPQRLIASAIYELPKVGNRSGFLGKMTNGWALSTVVTLQSGTPLTFLNTNSNNVFGTTSDFAYFNPTNTGCNDALGIGGSVRNRIGEFFNTACFTEPPVISPADGGTGFGNTRPGLMRGPNQHNVDLSLRKTTRLAERANLEFRAEFFNAFNSTQYSNPDTNYSDFVPREVNGQIVNVGQFGQITGTTVAPRVGQLALKLNF
ncbi:MAG: carboxypeptidase regulatory-like domain-containing protein [Terriglobales bacterium]